ncbi:MAG: hypothetical protein JNM59_10340 [Hyphomonadaceae bacterium]|nr:hypothetical protein [Hyphomonadaceae bacterium]
MIVWKYKLWRSASVAAVLGLAACGGEAGENAAHGEAGEAAVSAGGGEAGEASIGEAGGEHGEAGVATAYAGLEGADRTALRIQHLRGFVLIAEHVLRDTGDVAAASTLIQQGVMEVYDPATDQFGSLDVAPLRRAAMAGERPALELALRESDAAFRAADVDANQAEVIVRLVDVAAGIYQHVMVDGAVDPIEYQHSLGAALAAREALTAHANGLRGRNARAYQEAVAELDRFVSLWPASSAPPQPATYQQVLAQSSRVRLALSPYL